MKHENLKVAAYQYDIVWENPEANRLKIERWLSKADEQADLVVLPEMFTTGFTMNVRANAESMTGETVSWMKQMSAQHEVALCGSLIISENGKYYNRFVFVDPSGKTEFSDKRHLFTMANEESHFTRGENRLIIHYKGWRICPLICYDLRFPVWSRNINEYDILIYSANWPQNRKDVWNTLLQARAIENQAYVIGVNRVGEDGNSTTYSGNSQIINPRGIVLASTEDFYENSVAAALNRQDLISFRNSFPVLNDADSFKLE